MNLDSHTPRWSGIAGTDRRPWSGQWVADQLGVEVHAMHAPVGIGLPALVGLALRRNPRRAHLLVSTVLGKHIPTDPRLVYGAGQLLGALVADVLLEGTGLAGSPTAGACADWMRATLAGVPGAAGPLSAHAARLRVQIHKRHAIGLTGAIVLGYAETATALGHAVADTLITPYLHSTRRRVASTQPVGGFEEEHSHATSHLLLPEDPDLLAGPGPLILVDDELSTGQTVLNTIVALHALHPRSRYIVAALADLRSDTDRARMATVAESLGATIDAVALAAGRVDLPANLLSAGQQLLDEHDTVVTGAPASTAPPGAVTDLGPFGWPTGVRDGGRHGFAPAHKAAFDEAARTVACGLTDRLRNAGAGRDVAPGRVLVLGFEELMYAPLCIAVRLADALDSAGTEVRYSTTTRSPVFAVDAEDYPIRTRLVFGSHDDPADGPGNRFAYNVAAGASADHRFSDVVLVVDELADTPSLRAPTGLLAQLAGHCDRLHLVTLPSYRPGDRSGYPKEDSVPTSALGPAPTTATSALPLPLRGPTFGSYAPDDVCWLLKDLSHVDLEAPTEEREEAIQHGGAHYAESLPLEYQPDAAYQGLFTAALEASAARVAHAVGVVTEMALAERGPDAVLVSLARAGTPVGILMRRWARLIHGIDLPHYAMSIVRGRGIDTVALRYLAAHHDPASVMLVDGWTGKGAITRELAAAVEQGNRNLGLAADDAFSPDLAVLADPGRCVSIFGTREDFLIPSACLNSTVSGLVSRTVLNDAYIGAGDFHGAKFYRELAGADVSRRFLDTIESRFADVAQSVLADAQDLATADRTPTWAGWAAVEAVSQQYGIGDVNLVKPGVGETTRVLLRRIPWKVLVRPDAAGELAHIRLLAAQRGVDVVEVENLPYSCIGLIHPQFMRGATGEHGTAAGATPTGARA